MDNLTGTGSAGRGGEELYFGYYPVPLRIEREDLFISLEKEGEDLRFRRKCGAEVREKILNNAAAQLLFNPVEPVNKPRGITAYLLVELEETLVIKPRDTAEVFLTFPVEVAAFIIAEDDTPALLDVFSPGAPKYSLYGAPATGLICRYWRSGVYAAAPPADPWRAGTMRLSVINTLPRWTEMNKAVFSASDLQIYYSRSQAGCEAYLKILSETSAETGFSGYSPWPDMEPSIKLLAPRKTFVTGPRFVMEEGF